MSNNTSNAPLLTEGASANRLPSRERGTLSEVAGEIDGVLDRTERRIDAILGGRFGNEQPTAVTDVYNLPGATAVGTFVERPVEPAADLAADDDRNFLAADIPGARYTGIPIEQQIETRENIDELAARRAEKAAREGVSAAHFFAERGLAAPAIAETVDMVTPAQPNLAVIGDTVDMSGPDKDLSYLRAIEYEDVDQSRTANQAVMADEARTDLDSIYGEAAA